MLFDVQHIKISSRPTMHAAFAEPREAYAGSIFNSRRDFCFNILLA